MTDTEIIEAYVAKHGATKCPTVFLVPMHQLALDRIPVVPVFGDGSSPSWYPLDAAGEE